MNRPVVPDGVMPRQTHSCQWCQEPYPGDPDRCPSCGQCTTCLDPDDCDRCGGDSWRCSCGPCTRHTRSEYARWTHT